MNYATLFRRTIQRVPAAHRQAATLRTATGRETTATLVEGILKPDLRAFGDRTAEQQAGREFVMLADGLDFAPTLGMQLVVNSVTWILGPVEVMEPTDHGVPVAYRLVATR